MELKSHEFRMKNVIIFILLYSLVIASACNSKGQRTRSFVLTKDSSFIGAWGGMLRNDQTGYFPKLTKSFNMIFVYSKDNKIFISNRPEVFAKDTNEEAALFYYREFLSHDGDIPAFDDSYIMESGTEISKTDDEYSKYKYRINENNSLTYYYYSKTLSGEGELEKFTFAPYYFKTVKNPED